MLYLTKPTTTRINLRLHNSQPDLSLVKRTLLNHPNQPPITLEEHTRIQDFIKRKRSKEYEFNSSTPTGNSKTDLRFKNIQELYSFFDTYTHPNPDYEFILRLYSDIILDELQKPISGGINV